MRRPSREVQVFNLSMLDVISCALGAFIILVIMLLQQREDARDDAREAEAEMHETRAELHETRADLLEAKAEAEGAEAAREAARKAAEEREKAKAEAEKAKAALATSSREIVKNLDLVFAMDVTGSMRDEIDDLRVNLVGIVRILHRMAETLSVGFVAYRDEGDAFVTRKFPMTPMDSAGLERLQTFVDALEADGGGDFPEAVDVAVEEATRLGLRPEVKQVVIVVGDAPAHPGREARAYAAASGFHKSGRARRVSAIYTGSGGAADFFRDLARAGGGDFVDHRGRMMESVLLSVMEPK